MNLPGTPFDGISSDSKQFVEVKPSEPHEDPSTPRLRKHVTIACQPCKAGKVKCDGNNPCVRCLSRDIACSYRSDEDGRSRVPMKRKIENLERENAILHELMNQIWGADDPEVRQITSLVRSNASLPEGHNSLLRLREAAGSTRQRFHPLLEHLHNITKTALLQDSHSQPHQQLRSGQSSVATEPANRVLSVNRLIDNPIHQISAIHWTTVTQDDQLVSHLISLWVTWGHLFPHGIVLEPFLRDLKSGNADSLFCSPFLVSCVLAAACPYSDYDEAKTSRGTASELMVSFVREAKTRLAQSLSTPSITNVQGLGLLYVATGVMGQDRDGYHYAIQAATMGEELARAREGILETVKTAEAKTELAYVLDTTCWGVFSLTTASMSAWMRPQLVMQPKMRYPQADSSGTNFHTTQWSPYPHNGVVQQADLPKVLECHASLAVLTAELTDEVYGGRDNTDRIQKSEILEDIDTRLFFWHARLPETIKQASPENPHVIVLLMWYHCVFLKLRSERERHGIEAHRSVDKAKNKGSDRYQRPSNTVRGAQADPDLIKSALEIVQLGKMYRVRWGYSRQHCFMNQSFYLALYVLIAENSQGRYDSEIAEIFTSIRAMSRRFPFSFSLLHMTQIDLQQRGFEIPAAAAKLFEEFEQLDTVAWMEKASHNSIYPSPQLAVGPYLSEDNSPTDPYPTNMNEFLKTFNKLNIK